MLGAIGRSGKNPDITFSDSAALVRPGHRRGRRRHRGDRHRRRSVLGSGVRRGFLLRIRGLQLLRGCRLRIRRLYVFLRRLAERRRGAQSTRHLQPTSPPRRGVNLATARRGAGAAGTEAGGIDELQPFPPSEGEGDEYCETPTKEPAVAATEEPAAALVTTTGDVAEVRDRAQAETEAGAGPTLSSGDGAPAMPHDGFVFQTVTERPRRPRQPLALPAPLPPVDGADELQTSFTASDDCADELQCPVLGQCVEVSWDDDGKYYRCMFTAFDGKDVTILYDNGEEETVALAGLVYSPLDPRADVDGAASPSSDQSQALSVQTPHEGRKVWSAEPPKVEELAKISRDLNRLDAENYLLDDLDDRLGLLFSVASIICGASSRRAAACWKFIGNCRASERWSKVKSSYAVALQRPARLAYVLEEAGMDPDTEVTKDNAKEILAESSRDGRAPVRARRR